MTVIIQIPKPRRAAAPARGWRIELLGNLRALSGDIVVSRFRTEKSGFLLAYLALYRGRAHPREELIEIFWPEEEFEAARHNLRQTLFSLRHQVEPPGVEAGAVLLADRRTVALNAAVVATDVAEFEAAVRRAESAALWTAMPTSHDQKRSGRSSVGRPCHAATSVS